MLGLLHLPQFILPLQIDPFFFFSTTQSHVPLFRNLLGSIAVPPLCDRTQTPTCQSGHQPCQSSTYRYAPGIPVQAPTCFHAIFLLHVGITKRYCVRLGAHTNCICTHTHTRTPCHLQVCPNPLHAPTHSTFPHMIRQRSSRRSYGL